MVSVFWYRKFIIKRAPFTKSKIILIQYLVQRVSDTVIITTLYIFQVQVLSVFWYRDYVIQSLLYSISILLQYISNTERIRYSYCQYSARYIYIYIVSMFGWNIIFIHSDQYDYSTLNSIIILHNIICIIIPIQYLEKIKSDTVTDTECISITILIW